MPIAKDTTSTKRAALRVLNDQQVQLTGTGQVGTVCFNPGTQVFTVAETEPAGGVRYEFRHGRARCDSNGQVTREDQAVEVTACSDTSMRVRCSEGAIINYGGRCEGPGIAGLFPNPWDSSDATWGSLPTLPDILFECDAGRPAKSVWLTCIREAS